jgi:hypothetical protein
MMALSGVPASHTTHPLKKFCFGYLDYDTKDFKATNCFLYLDIFLLHNTLYPRYLNALCSAL